MLSFSSAELKAAAERWRGADFRCVPDAAYGRIMPLVAAADALIADGAKDTVIIALDGRCASGKTTAAAWLAEIYDCNVFHMDDFFLRPEQRSAERLSVPGENVDHERFLDEILLPLSEGRDVTLRRFSCHELRLEDPSPVPHRRLNIVEGSYSLHPSLRGFYDLKVFSDITPGEQRERIIRRSPDRAEMFFAKWVPLEERYFSALGIREKADMVI